MLASINMKGANTMNVYPMHFNDDRYTNAQDSGGLNQPQSSADAPESSKELIVPMTFYADKSAEKVEDEDYVPSFCQPEEPVSPKPIINPSADSRLELPVSQSPASSTPRPSLVTPPPIIFHITF